MPRVDTILENIATVMTEYENHRTADHHEMSLTQKIVVLNAMTNYLPIFLTAFVYVPFGDQIIPMLQHFIYSTLGTQDRSKVHFQADPNRLRNEVISLVGWGQLFDAIGEVGWPLLTQWYRDRQVEQSRNHCDTTYQYLSDDPSEAGFLRRVRKQALRPAYNVQEDITEMVIQFGYLALFSPVWPIVSIGFFIND